MFYAQPTLTGPGLTVGPTTTGDWPALFAVASDPLIWEIHPSSGRWQEPVFRTFFEDGLASGGMLTVRANESGAVIGSSRYSSEFADDDEVEIGWTFLDRARWGGAVNRELKHLMLTHAFGSFGTVIFRVGGVIAYTGSRYNVAPNVTIAGQTAPGDGVTLYGDGIGYNGSHNTITRFIRYRMGINGSSDKDAIAIDTELPIPYANSASSF